MGAPVIFNGTRSKLLTANGLLTSAGRTIDYDGDINYIANNGAEINATGYSAFADAASSTPTDGTGGSPTVTIARSTSSPLVGSASLLFTKDAANRQGQGFSYDFTIDSAYQAKAFSISFLYKIASGTYVDNDMSVWIYDVTNSTIIQPSGYNILNATGTVNQVAQFQTASNSTSYRLIFYCGSTSASAYTVNFDQVTVAPNTYNAGAATTAWTAYTPTYTGFGTVSTSNMYWRRVGDMLEVQGSFVFGTTTAVNAAISLPSGLTLDTTKIASTAATNTFGTAFRASNSAFNFASANIGPWPVIDRKDLSTTAVYIGTTASGNIFGSGNGNSIGASGEVLGLSFTVPIAGWGVTQVLSSDTATNVVTASITLSGNTAVTANVLIPFDTVVFDTTGSYSTSTKFYTVPVPGYYSITGTAIATSAAGGIYVQVSGTKKGYVCPSNTTNVGGGGVIVKCVAGDTIGFYSDTSNTLTATNGGSPITVMSIQRIAGPAQIAASETVKASYYLAANVTPGTGNPIKYDTKIFDSHSAYSTSTGLFTAPMSGTYLIVENTNYASGSTGYIQLYKNSSAQRYMGIFNATISLHSASALLQLVAGDTVSLRPDNGGVVAGQAIPFGTSLDIVRVGN